MILLKSLFLDASTHLYKRVCTSVGLSFGLSVGNQLFFTGRYNKEKMRQPPCLHIKVPLIWADTFPDITGACVRPGYLCVRLRCS